MEEVLFIKNSILELYKSNPNIHISLKLNRPKVIIEDMPAVITVVFNNIFEIKVNENGTSTSYTHQYGDVLVGRIHIQELNYQVSTSKKR